MRSYHVTIEDRNGNKHFEVIKAANAVDASKIARIMLSGYGYGAEISYIREI